MRGDCRAGGALAARGSCRRGRRRGIRRSTWRSIPGHSQADVGAVGNGLAEHLLTLRPGPARPGAPRGGPPERPPDPARRPAADRAASTLWTTTRSTPSRRRASRPACRRASSCRSTSTAARPRSTAPRPTTTPSAPPTPTADDGAGDRAAAPRRERAATPSGYPDLDRGVKSDLSAGKPYGHFFSLRGPVPSALVESLFLSSTADAAALHDDATLDALADGVAQGILEYLAGAPAAGSTRQRLQPQAQHHHHRLGDDVGAHLALADPPVDEDDRHLGDAQPALVAAVVHLDLECVAVRVHAGQIQPLERAVG